MRKQLIATVSAIALAAPLLTVPVLAPASATDMDKTGAGVKTEAETTAGQNIGQDIGQAVDKAGKEIGDAYQSTVEAGKDLVKGAPELNNKIVGKTVRTTDGVSVGAVKDVIASGGATRVQEVVIGTGGVLGLGEKEVAIPAEQIRYDAMEKSVIVSMTEEEFESLASSAGAGRGVASDAVRGEAGFSADMAAIVGKPVHSQDGKQVGEVKDVVLDEDGKRIDQIVIGSGGVLGLGEKEIAVKPMQLRVNEEQKAVVLAMTEAQFKQALEAKVRVIQ